MAYFRCAFSNSGATLTVECDSFMAGAIVTCSNGVKTLQGLCPSTSPYEVTFKIPEEGTWVVSTVVSGATYSTSVNIDFSFEASLSGFSWMRWLTEGGLDPSDYNDLSEVLADEKALRQLNLVHASVDYLASIITTHPDVETIIAEGLFAKWANLSDYALDKMEANAVLSDLMDDADLYGYGELIEDNGSYVPKGNVPVMTSNTAPYGVASSSTNNSGADAYMAFDDNENTTWTTAGNATNNYIAYKFTNPVCIKKVIAKMKLAPASGYTTEARTFTIQASNDGTTWDDVGALEVRAGSQSVVEFVDVEDEIDNTDYYLYCRAFCDTKIHDAAHWSIQFASLQFYGRELKVSVPTMTSNTAPYGEVSSSAALYNTYNPYKAFDKSDSTGWYQISDNSASLTYDFSKPMLPRMVAVTNFLNQSNFYRISKFKVQGSNDNSTWTDLTEDVSISTTALSKAFADLNASVEYRYINILMTMDGVITEGGVAEIQIYGKDYSEKEFANDGSKWLYDHGVELETLQVNNPSMLTKNSDSFVLEDASTSLYGRAGVDYDLTGFNLFRGRLGKIASPMTEIAIQIIATVSTLSSDSYKYLSDGDNPNTALVLDASSFNQTKCVAVSVAARQTSSTGKVEITELWLE